MKPYILKTLDLRNHKGRVFFTTDLHAHFYLLEKKYQEVDFDFRTDILIVGGDCLDRGLQNNLFFDYIDNPWVHCIRGNHEELFIQTFVDNFKGAAARCLYENGGEWVFDLYDKGHYDFLKLIYDYLIKLPLAIEVITENEKIGIVHAQVPKNNWNSLYKMSNRYLEDFGRSALQWSRENYDNRSEIIIKGVDRVLVGHKPTKSLEIEILGNTWYCDLGSFYSKKIAFLQIK